MPRIATSGPATHLPYRRPVPGRRAQPHRPFPSLAYTSRSKTWGPAPSAPAADQLDVKATNIATVTIDPPRARVDCNATLNVHTDGPLTVTLAGCNRTEHYTG